MKSYTFKIKKITYVYKYGFYASLPVLLRGCLCLCMAVFLISCATVPQQTYLRDTSLLGISKVAVVVSASAPNVSYSINAPESGIAPMLFLSLLGMGLEAVIRSGVDQADADKIQEHMDFSHIENKMAQSFIQPIKKSACFLTTEYVTAKNQDNRQLSTTGYDAVIRLVVRNISLERTAGDNVNLYVYVSGQMEYLASGKIVWDREEVVSSPEPHALDYYKENELKELDAMLEKAGKNLAYDFIYLK